MNGGKGEDHQCNAGCQREEKPARRVSTHTRHDSTVWSFTHALLGGEIDVDVQWGKKSRVGLFGLCESVNFVRAYFSSSMSKKAMAITITCLSCQDSSGMFNCLAWWPSLLNERAKMERALGKGQTSQELWTLLSCSG